MARTLGEAFIAITPDMKAFAADMRAKLKAAMAGTKAELPVALDQRQFESSVAAIKAKIATLKALTSDVKLNADTTALTAKIAAANAELAKLRTAASDTQLRAESKDWDSKIAAAYAELARLRASASDVKLDADDKAVVAKITGMQAQVAHLENALEHMTAMVDIRAAEAKIEFLNAEIARLQSNAEALKFDANMSALNTQIAAQVAKIQAMKDQAKTTEFYARTEQLAAAIAAQEAKIAAMKDDAKSVKFGADVTKLNTQIALEEARLAELTRNRNVEIDAKVDTSSLAKLSAILFGAGGAAGAGGGGGGGSGGGLIGGFGTFGLALNRTVGGIKLWHVILSAGLETLIAVGTAAAAAAVGIAAIAPAAKDVALHMQAVDVVNESLGNQIPSLSRDFDRLAQSMAPQVIEGYGGILNIVSKNTGVLGSTAHQVVNIFDTWIAKLDIWNRTSGGFGKILQLGTGFLNQLGTAIGHVLSALDNLLQKDPGTARVLVDIVNAFARMLDWVSKLPAPIVETALALHSAYIWGSIAAAVLGRFPGILGAAGRAFAGLGALAKTGIAALALIALEIGLNWSKSSIQVRNSVASMENALDSMSASKALVQLPVDIGNLNNELRSLGRSGTAGILSQWHGLNDIWVHASSAAKVLGGDVKGIFTGSAVSELKSIGNVFHDIFSLGFVNDRAATVALKQDMANLNAEINKMLGSSGNLDHEIGSLVKRNYTFTQALALMDLAGVKWNDTQAVMAQKVDNLINGFEAMSVRGSLLANSVNAITFASSLQNTKVDQLNTSWDTFIQTVSGGQSTMITFGQNVSGMYQAAASAGAHLTDSNGRVSSSFGALSGKAASTKGSFTGLNTTSLALQQTFDQSVTDANAYLDSLTTMAAAAGLGKKGTALLAGATKDLVALLLPAAAKSQTLTAILYALAQRGGYTGADSFKQLSKWVGNVKNPMADLQKTTQTFTVASAGLTTDVKNLSVALGQTLTGAMSQAIFLASGGQKSFDNFAKSVLTSHGNLDKIAPSAKTLADQLLKMTHNTTQAHAEFVTFAESLGLSRAQAEKLWSSATSKGNPTLDALNIRAKAAIGNFSGFGKGVSDTANAITKKVPAYQSGWKGIFGSVVSWLSQSGTDITNWATRSVPNAFSKAIDWLHRVFGTDISNFFTKTLPNVWDSSVSLTDRHFVKPLENALNSAWAWVSHVFGTDISNFFTRTLPGVWDSAVNLTNRRLVKPTESALSGTWNWISHIFGTDLSNFFTRTLPNVWDSAVHLTGTRLINPLKNAFSNTWNWISHVFGSDLSNFFTKTLPSMFGSAVSRIGSMWNRIVSVIKNPIHVVGADVLAPLFRGIDAVTNFVHLGTPLAGAANALSKLATGGRIPGFGGGDIVPALLEPGEAVVDKHRTKRYADVLGQMGVPGFEAGGLVQKFGYGGYVNPVGQVRGLSAGRVDMGVDFGGSGPLRAMGPGIVNATNIGGWPGGPFMSYKLTSGPLSGANIYYAENIRPTVLPNAGIKAGEVIANMFRGSSGIEIGFADSTGHLAEASTAAAGGYREGQHTAVGQAMEDLLVNLGAPRAPNAGAKTVGKIPGGGVQAGGAGSSSLGSLLSGLVHAIGSGIGGVIQTIEQIFGGLGDMAKFAIDLGHGDVGGAVRALLGVFKPNAGGAQGEFGQTLLGVPATVVGDVSKFLVAKIKSFVSSTQASEAAAGGGSLGPGTASYAHDIQLVLKSLKLPLSLTANWLKQIQTESGGSLTAVNMSDSNARAGHPSVGLLQLIPSTFHAFAGPYVNTPPLVNKGGGTVSENAMAQIYAAIHYAYARYGAGMGSVIGHGHGYANGGVISEPIVGYGLRTGAGYSFGEKGPETVTPGFSGGGQTDALLRQLIKETQRNTQAVQQSALLTGRVINGAAGRGYLGR